MMKLVVNLKRKKWQWKLQNTKMQILHRCLAISNKVCSFRRNQESRDIQNPRCSEATLAVAVQPTSCLPKNLVEEIPNKKERSRENTSCSVTTTTLAIEIPDELVEEILHHLTVYYLVRLKLVSKKWKSLVESRHLAEKHTRLHQKKYGAKKIVVERSESGTFHVRYSANPSGVGTGIRVSNDPIRLPGSCSGLVCFYDLVYVYLFNPMTLVLRTLPSPLGTKAALIPAGELSVGIGRDVVTGRYKVVVLFGSGNDNRLNSKVFDLSTSKWRRRYKSAGPVSLSFTLIGLDANPVFVNGSLFWLLARHHTEILVMDLHTEKFRTVLLPNDIPVTSLGLIYMWNLKDRLFVSDLTRHLDSDLWVLVRDEVTERWERTRFHPDADIPPLTLDSAWFSQSLVSPYQSETYNT